MTRQEQIEQAARELVESEINSMDDSSYSMHEKKRLQMFDGYYLEEALCNFAEQMLSRQWISVDEEFPPIDEKCVGLSIDVIVKNEYGKVTTAWYSYSGHNWHLCYGEIQGDDLIHSKITHWMPIPPLSKGGEQ